jgi:uncharacterized membrane protein YvbJ
MAWSCTTCGRITTDAYNTCRLCGTEKTREQAAEAKARARVDAKNTRASGIAILMRIGLPIVVAVGLRIGISCIPRT